MGKLPLDGSLVTHKHAVPQPSPYLKTAEQSSDFDGGGGSVGRGVVIVVLVLVVVLIAFLVNWRVQGNLPLHGSLVAHEHAVPQPTPYLTSIAERFWVSGGGDVGGGTGDVGGVVGGIGGVGGGIGGVGVGIGVGGRSGVGIGCGTGDVGGGIDVGGGVV